MTRCSICKALITPSDPTATCAVCDSKYHQECWDRNGGCATYGCSAAPLLEKSPLQSVIGRGWGDEKECPACGQNISSSLLVCRCSARFPWADPMTPAEYQEWVAQEASRSRNRMLLAALFVVSLFGLPAPIAGAVAGIQAYRHREDLAGENGPFLALGYGAAVIGAVYSLIFLLLYAGL